MYVYAGIDEAGYGPLLGPLLVGRCVMAIPDLDATAKPPDLWDMLSKAVCRTLTGRQGRIAVNDSKKIHTPSSGIAHIERGVLAFAAMAGHQPASLDQWLTCAGEKRHVEDASLPRWYQPCDDHPWNPLPHALDAGELAVCRGSLRTCAQKAGVQVLDMSAAVVFEDQFNQMVSVTRSKAATSFTFVARHLRAIWDQHGRHHPHVAVDRQSGRSHYRELLATSFPEAFITILAETETASAYLLEDADTGRSMNVAFLVEGEQRHMPVALASMISKYTREMLMVRFNQFFNRHWPELKPTAGYATDGRRFINEIAPRLHEIGLTQMELCRIA